MVFQLNDYNPTKYGGETKVSLLSNKYKENGGFKLKQKVAGEV